MASDDARKLFVAGLPDSVTEEVLRDLFAESGSQVTDLTVPRDRMSGRPRGFAFVRLGTQEDADRARHVLDGRIVDGRPISVRPFQAEPPVRGERPAGGDRGGFRPGGDRPAGGGYGGDRPAGGGYGGGGGAGGNASDRTLYVGNLPYDTSQEEMESLLREAGVDPVIRVHLPVDQDGRKRGFGFVTLGTAEVAKNALEQLKGADIRGRRLNINIANPKGEGGPRPMGGGGGGGTGAPMGDRPPRSFGGGGGGFGGPPSNPGFGPSLPPGGKPIEGKRKKRFEGGGEGEGKPGARGSKRDRDDRWGDTDDDD